MRRFFFFGLVFVAGALAVAAESPNKEAEITSDRLQLQKGGVETLFQGNVFLKQLAQWIKADKMTRSRVTGVAEAYGHVRGTWFTENKEKIIGLGDRARYIPLSQTTELWSIKETAQLTRWETERDTQPVVMHAMHFTAKQQENRMLAHTKVVITQTPRFESHSEEGLYDRTAGTLTLWGQTQVQMHINDGKGSGDFVSDKAIISLNPKKAHLTGNVKGHVIPSTT